MSELRIGDASNPFHRASFYVEQLKYGPRPKGIEGVTFKEISAQMEVLLREAAVTTMTGAQLVETLDWYAESFRRTLGLNTLIAKSVFTDGVLHGIAFAAGLVGEVPR